MTQTLDPALRGSDAAGPQQRVDAWLTAFEAALAARDIDTAAGMFATDSFWRDLVAFTWNIKTVEGRSGVADLLAAQLADTDPSGFHTTEPPTEADGVISAWIGFETGAGRGAGHLRLTDEGAWTMLTALQELKGHEEGKGTRRPKGVRHGADRDRVTWSEQREREQRELGYARQPYVLIVGGGQGGIALGARMRQLGVPALVVDKHDRPGDQWRKRYKSLCLHDPVWYDHLPYLPFPDNWPVFAPKDKVGDWLEMYTKVMEVPYWSKTTCTSARYDEAAGAWTVEVERDGEQVVLRPQHLVLATGMSGKPNIPDFPGMERFRGDQHHSSRHPGPDRYAGKRAVVIGANNSAHDICAALWEAGAEVTMVQRSSTHIVKSDSLMELGLGDLYSERALAAGMTTQKADLTFASLPYRIMHEFQIPIYDAIRARDADFLHARLRDPDSGLTLDGVHHPDGRVNRTVHTYCQGVAIGLETELAVRTGEAAHRDRAAALVAAAGTELTNAGVIVAATANDSGLFMGILARYLAETALALGDTTAAAIVHTSARAAWAHRAEVDGLPLFGMDWSRPIAEAEYPSSLLHLEGPGTASAANLSRDLSVQLSGWMLLEADHQLTAAGR